MILMHFLNELPEYFGGSLGLFKVGHVTRSRDGSMF